MQDENHLFARTEPSARGDEAPPAPLYNGAERVQPSRFSADSCASGPDGLGRSAPERYAVAAELPNSRRGSTH